LEDEQGPGVIVPAPADPEHVAGKENPEALLALGLRLRGNGQAERRVAGDFD
jgi:hypothetical protein